MKIYRFAIDETGSFTINKGDTSFVCGVLISENKNALRDKYKELYVDLEIGEKAPDDDDKLLKKYIYLKDNLYCMQIIKIGG